MKMRMPAVLASMLAAAVAVVGLVAVATPSNAVDGATTSSEPASFVGASIYVDGTEVLRFDTVVGISSIANPDGTSKPATFTVGRVFRPDRDALHVWHEAAMGDPSAKRTFVLRLYDSRGQVAGEYLVEAGWPRKIQVADETTARELVTFAAASLTRLDV